MKTPLEIITAGHAALETAVGGYNLGLPHVVLDALHSLAGERDRLRSEALEVKPGKIQFEMNKDYACVIPGGTRSRVVSFRGRVGASIACVFDKKSSTQFTTPVQFLSELAEEDFIPGDPTDLPCRWCGRPATQKNQVLLRGTEKIPTCHDCAERED